MDKLARLPAEDRRDIFSEAAARLGIRPTIIEKDFWVCVVLKLLFQKSRFGKSLVFKGGTSLSKAHGLIERFSEDIDLVLDWNLIGFGEGLRDPMQEFTSKGKQDQFNKEINRIDVVARFAGAGLWNLPVVHEGNQSYSPEEVEVISNLVNLLTGEGNSWTDRNGVARSLTRADFLCVAPFNDQVNRLKDRLPDVQVGTVDKFQGQQAAVVIYSLIASSPQDAPRGMEFLYNLNRFNVATSRARCACIVVGSPLLLSPECRTPRQMELANILCRYNEVSERVSTGSAAAAG